MFAHWASPPFCVVAATWLQDQFFVFSLASDLILGLSVPGLEAGKPGICVEMQE